MFYIWLWVCFIFVRMFEMNETKKNTDEISTNEALSAFLVISFPFEARLFRRQKNVQDEVIIPRKNWLFTPF